MSNAMNTMMNTLEAGRIALSAAIAKYNSTEWSVEAQAKYDAACAKHIAAQYDVNYFRNNYSK